MVHRTGLTLRHIEQTEPNINNNLYMNLSSCIRNTSQLSRITTSKKKMKLLSGSYLDAAYVAIAIISYMDSNLEAKSVCTNIHLSSIKPCRSALPMLRIPQYGHCNNVIQRKDFYVLALPQIYYHEAGHDIPGCFPSG